MDIEVVIVFLIFIILLFIAFNVLINNLFDDLQTLNNEQNSTDSNSSGITEQEAILNNDYNTVLTNETTFLFDNLRDFILSTLTKPVLFIIAVIIIILTIVFQLFTQRYRYVQIWKESYKLKKQERLKTENSGYSAYLVSLQISEKLDYLVTSDGKTRKVYNDGKTFYKSNKSFEQIQKMLKDIQAVYTTFMKDNNLKMNGYEVNFVTVLKTIKKSDEVAMLDNHKVLEGIFSTIQYIHSDIVGSVEDTITKDLQREYEITRTIKDRHKNNRT